MAVLPAVSANDESIAPIGRPVIPLSRIAPRRDRDQKAQQRKPAPQDNKPKPG
jgi:hypothetical protein